MKWVTKIELINYRAFFQMENPITIPNGYHVLTYGENGSGKTSLFHALDHVLRTSYSHDSAPYQRNKFAPADEPTFIEIEVSSDSLDSVPQIFRVSDDPNFSTNRDETLQLASKIRGFLDYKKILAVHAIGHLETSRPNVFDLLVKTLLSDHEISSPEAGATDVELYKEYKRISKILLEKRAGSNDFNKAKSDLANWNLELENLLSRTLTIANRFLFDYFGNKLHLDLDIVRADVYKPRNFSKKAMKGDIRFKLSYAGTGISNYHLFLNEARLSAFSICLFLASIKTGTIQAADLRIIYLDDVFIGMDNGNRMPLIEILKNEFLRSDVLDQKFQLFLSTYDRQWYELAKSSFSGDGHRIHAIEMFVEDDGNPNTPDVPIVLPSEGNVEKAEAHFRRKDYPLTAHLLRKESERILKAYLPPKYLVNAEGNQISKFEVLLAQLSKYLDDLCISQPAVIASIKTYRTAVLNPSSHSDLECPIFRQEVEKVFNLVSALRSLPEIRQTEVVIPVKSQFILEIHEANYLMELELARSISKSLVASQPAFSKVVFFIKSWTHNNVLFGVQKLGVISPADSKTINKFTTNAQDFTSIVAGIAHQIGPIVVDPMELVISQGGQSLKSLLS